MKVRSSVKKICDKCKVIKRRGVIREETRGLGDLWEEVDLEIGGKRVGEAHVPRERREHEIAQLDARRRRPGRRLISHGKTRRPYVW